MFKAGSGSTAIQRATGLSETTILRITDPERYQEWRIRKSLQSKKHDEKRKASRSRRRGRPPMSDEDREAAAELRKLYHRTYYREVRSVKS